jgi:Crp-like helix-turn-helix domain
MLSATHAGVSAIARRHLAKLLIRQSHPNIRLLALGGFHSFRANSLVAWLLALQDRTVGHDLEITHEVFAKMLGVRRVGITQAAKKLQEAGLIRYSWGKLTILDRHGSKPTPASATSNSPRRTSDCSTPPGPTVDRMGVRYPRRLRRPGER